MAVWCAALALGCVLAGLSGFALDWGRAQLDTGTALCADTLRLHIKADSDSLQDQTAKLAVRDALLAYTDAQCRASTQPEALHWAAQNLPALELTARQTLARLGLAPADYPFSCTGISGYSGGGKKMIAEYESPDRPAHSKLDAPKSYGLGLAHKHLPEMQKISGLGRTPAFVPVVCDYYSGMQVLVPLDLKLAGTTAEAAAEGIANYYRDGATVKVHALNETLPENGLYSNAMAGSDRMELYLTVNAAGDQMMLVSLFDNLGKGSSGAAIQCMNLMLGLEETKGLE